MTKRNLILIHRGPEYEKDFDEIAVRVNALDKDITIYHLPSSLQAELPVSAWQHPTLTVALVPKFRLPVRRGPVLRAGAIQKLTQQETFRKHAIPTPPALPFKFGMKLDPVMFGDLVVLKTLDLSQTSGGDKVFLFRRRRLEALGLNSLAPDHPVRIYPKSFMVQKFINTGELPSYYRVSTFLGHVLYAWHTSIKEKRAPLNCPDDILEQSIVDIKGGTMLRSLSADDDVLSLSLVVAKAFAGSPLLGIDIVRDESTRKLYVLEVNAGGNTWHFSSSYGRSLRVDFGICGGGDESTAEERGRQCLMDQFSAFDVAAESLVDKTRTSAS